MIRSRRLLSWIVQPVVFLALVGVAAWWVGPLLLLVFPGIVLARSREDRGGGLADGSISVVSASITFWVLSFFPLRFIGLPLSRVAYGVILGVSLVVAWRLGRRPVRLGADRESVVASLLLGLAVALRLALYWRGPLAPGGDMNMHCYLAALIVHADGLPSSQRPLLPVDHFGAYPPAFHALAALSSLVSSLSVADSTRLWIALVFALVTLALYALLRLFFSPAPAALAAVLASFVPRQPQDQVGGGAVPTVLAFVFVILGLAQFLRLLRGPSVRRAAACGAFSAASILAHLSIPAAAALAAAPPLLWGLARSRPSRAAQRAVALRALVAAGVVAAALAPSLPVVLTNRVSRVEIDWIRGYQHSAIRSMFGESGVELGVVAHFAGNAVGWGALVLGAAGLVTLVRRRLVLGSASIIFAVCVWALVLNARSWFLPLSALLYPDRIVMLLVIPLAVGLAVVADGALASARGVVVWATVVIALGVAAAQSERYFFHTSRLDSRVGRDDLHAMRWISRQTEPDAIFRNRWEDAGLWIPCLAFRAVTNPHQSPFYFDEFREGARALRPHYLYVSETARPAGRALELIGARPEIYRNVYERGAVRIFEVPGDFDERAWLETLRLPAGLAKTIRLTIATDRDRYTRDDNVRVSGGLQSAGSERFVDWYVVLRRVGGPLVYWAPLARGAWLNPEAWLLQHSNYPMPDIPLAGLQQGTYRIEMIVAEPYTKEILAWAHTDITLGP